MDTKPYILAIESSCDDTSVAVLRGADVLSNVVYSQKIHESFGGVVPELASRAHEQKIVITVQAALTQAHIEKSNIQAIAVTQGPGLVGSLLVGVCFAKAMALALDIPLIAVNHMQAHVLSPMIKNHHIEFPSLCLVVSGGHTQLVWVESESKMKIVGQTIDDAAGELFDKAAKMLQLPYPGGPLIDRYAQSGNPNAYQFSKPNIQDLDFSFSGLKTSILYTLQKFQKSDPDYVLTHRDDLCASIQSTIVDILISKTKRAIELYHPKSITLAGGVSANSRLRVEFEQLAKKYKIFSFIPEYQFCTDNAAMIGYAAYFKYQKQEFATQELEPLVTNFSL